MAERKRHNANAFISFYDIKTSEFKKERNYIQVCETEPTHQKTITSLAFSSDSKQIAALIDGAEVKAIVWEWFDKNKSRIVGQYEFQKTFINKISFSPSEANIVCTSGQGHWKVWRPQENTFTVYQKIALSKDNYSFTDHCWLLYDRMAATTVEGEIVILENFEEKQLIDNAFGTQELQTITTVAPFSKGFFVASDKGHIAMWVRAEENNQSTGKDGQYYDFIRSWRVSLLELPHVIHMDLNHSEEYLAVACRNNNSYIVHVKTVGLNESMDKEVKVEMLARGFHSGAITAMDIATQRPMLVTASYEDSTIRIWNYYNF